MTSGSSQSLIRPSRPIDAITARTLRVVDQAARAVGTTYVIAGAVARDLVLTNICGLAAGRATRDIDFGIAVENWDQFRALKEQLIAGGQFALTPAQQRVVYKDQPANVEVLIDLIPFGAVAPADSVTWPPNNDVVMNVSGFTDAWTAALHVVIDDDLIVRVASLPGLTLLKLIAWIDRHRQNNKDAADLHRLLSTYHEANNLDRLYEEGLDLLERSGFDVEQAGAGLLGQDVARICSEHTAEQVRQLLNSEQLCDALVGQMIQAASYQEASEAVTLLLRNFRQVFLRQRGSTPAP